LDGAMSSSGSTAVKSVEEIQGRVIVSASRDWRHARATVTCEIERDQLAARSPAVCKTSA
jgi:hypothetical protein